MLVDAGIFLTTFFMVLVMEMGDKTQFLVMALASRYKPGQVFLGIVIGVFFLNLLAVLLGTVIGGIKVLHDGIQAGAALLFIFFGLLSLWPEKAEENKQGQTGTAAIAAISLAFFFAELGDKTQLSTFSFAAVYHEKPFSVFLGSGAGLIAADSLGLVAGALILRHVPKNIMAMASACLFVAFGLFNGYTALTRNYGIEKNTSLIIIGALFLFSLIAGTALLFMQKKKKVR